MSQVATIVEIMFDMVSSQLKIQQTFTQMKILVPGEYMKVVTWTVISLVLIVLSGILAVPAMLQVGRCLLT